MLRNTMKFCFSILSGLFLGIVLEDWVRDQLNAHGYHPEKWLGKMVNMEPGVISANGIDWPFALGLALIFFLATLGVLSLLLPISKWLKRLLREGNKASEEDNRQVNDLSLDRARGDALWLKDKALSRSMRVMNQEALDGYHGIRNSDHIVWTDQETSRARNHFLHYVGLVIDRDVFNTADEYRAAEVELKRWWGVLDAKLSHWRR
ncbi:MAG: hypothetical protein KQJ78_13100 [Deltaproteobacteria bacterium]|nr:hypothetical protein [Deltaproteobacteria bacterium]